MERFAICFHDPPRRPEALDDFLLGHSVAVVYNPDLLDAIECITAKLDLDLAGVRVQRIPNHLDEAGDRRRRTEPLKVFLVEFNVKVHGG